MSLIETAKGRFAATEAVEASLRSEIQEIVRAYRHSWDIYSELIQNSVDAINRRHTLLNDPGSFLYSTDATDKFAIESGLGYQGRIKLRVDIPANTITIYDNGVGIPLDKIESFLLPKGGDKTLGHDYGFKGFGLTFVAFISEEFSITSKYFVPRDGEAHKLALNGLFTWMVDTTAEFPTGPVPDVTLVDDNMGEWNTIIQTKLAYDYPSRFPAVSAADKAIVLADCGWPRDPEEEQRPEGFLFLLRTKTALGNTRPLFSRPPKVEVTCELEVVTPDRGTVSEIEIPYLYYHPKEHREVSSNAYDFAAYFQLHKLAGSIRTFRGLYHAVPDVEVGTRKKIKCDMALATISSTRLSNIESALGLDTIDSGDVSVTYGVHLAIGGMPTGLRIDDWDMKGNDLKRYYVVVDSELDISSQLDPGRKGISSYFAKQISDRALELINTVKVDESESFAKFASAHLDHGRGYEEGGLPSQDFGNRVTEAHRYERRDEEANPDLINILRSHSSLRRFPREEQEVVALFFELLSKKIIKGYRTVYLSGSNAPYDAALEYQIDALRENCVPEDALGIGQVLVEQLKRKGLTTYRHADFSNRRHPELCVDFKAELGRFLDEMRRPGRTSKDPKQIDLLVFWDTSIPPTIRSTTYTLQEIIDNQRIFHSTTHRLGLREPDVTEIPCISIKDVLLRLPKG